MLSVASCSTKRKRTPNTASEQYEMYLQEMENDYIFRSGTIDPTVEPGYIEKKWEHLTSKLNAVARGPVLTKEVWQKRLKDWKNSTRAKYRKIHENRTATGGGMPTEKLELSELEERGLQVWGKVAVTGTPLVTITGGIFNDTHPDAEPVIIPSEDEVVEEIILCDDGTIKKIDKWKPTNETVVPEIQEQEDGLPNKLKNKENSQPSLTPTTPRTKLQSEKYRKKKKIENFAQLNLNVIGAELKKSYDANQNTLEHISNNIEQLSNSISKYSNIYEKVQSDRNSLQERHLNFEIAKYKYENTDFDFTF